MFAALVGWLLVAIVGGGCWIIGMEAIADLFLLSATTTEFFISNASLVATIGSPLDT